MPSAASPPPPAPPRIRPTRPSPGVATATATTAPADAVDDGAVLAVVLGGVLALAVAMGIGRFAFTPLLPLMLRDGQLDAAGGAEWAAANYAGYLLGALSAARFGDDPRRGLRLGLLGVAATTLAVAALGAFTAPGWLPAPGLSPIVGRWTGALLRAAAGVCSAWTLVCASGWCLAELARRQAARHGAWIYTGVGLGITLAGGLAWLGGRQPAALLWAELGALALAGAVGVPRGLPPRPPTTPPQPTAAPSPAPAAAASSRSDGYRSPAGTAALVLCYGSFGFGYIMPATFLPAMARQQVGDPLVFGLTWPLFGLAAALSVAAAARWLAAWPRRRLWALAQAVMALGTALVLFTQALWALALAAVLVGGTFMVATMAGLQLARELRPDRPTPLLARMTVAFAAGQIAGPLLVRSLPAGLGGANALAVAHAAATLLLGLTAAWLWAGARHRLPTPNHSPDSR